QGIERSPAEAEAAGSNPAGRTSAESPVSLRCGLSAESLFESRHVVSVAIARTRRRARAAWAGRRARLEESRSGARHRELGRGRDLDAHVAQGEHAAVRIDDGAGHAPDRLALERNLGVVRRRLAGVDPEHPQAAVDVPAIVETRDRLLTRVAALGEGDGPLHEARLGRQDAVVDLAPVARRARPDPFELELLLADGRLEIGGEHLA